MFFFADDEKRLSFNKFRRITRTKFYAYQINGLNQVFDKEQYPDPVQRKKIAHALELEIDTITVC